MGVSRESLLSTNTCHSIMAMRKKQGRIHFCYAGGHCAALNKRMNAATPQAMFTVSGRRQTLGEQVYKIVESERLADEAFDFLGQGCGGHFPTVCTGDDDSRVRSKALGFFKNLATGCSRQSDIQ